MWTAQQMVLEVDDDAGRTSLDLHDMMEEVGMTYFDTAVANMNSPNGRVDWTQKTGDYEVTFKSSRTRDGVSESLPKGTQITVTLQIWGSDSAP